MRQENAKIHAKGNKGELFLSLQMCILQGVFFYCVYNDKTKIAELSSR